MEAAFYTPCPDSDYDGIIDCEESFLGTDWTAADTDADGLDDAYELAMPGCNPTIGNGDDGDGFSTTAEDREGTSPCIWDSGGWGCVNGPLRVPGCDVDSDGDGCADAWELGPTAGWGGRRDPQNPWDFFEVPDVNGQRDGSNSSVWDILWLATRFGARGSVIGAQSAPNSAFTGARTKRRTLRSAGWRDHDARYR
jgi:hypothetical protein